MANTRWRMLGEVLANWRENNEFCDPPEQIEISDGSGNSALIDRDELERGDLKTQGEVTLDQILGWAHPLRHVVNGICKAYDISPILLRPYESASLSGPVLIRPPTSLKKKRHDLHREPAQPDSDDVVYFYPKQHLASSRVYPLCFVAKEKGTIHTPEHRHPGSEILVVIEGQALQTVGTRPEYTLKEEELFHFRSDEPHFTRNDSNGLLRVWTFRELNPRLVDSRDATLANQAMLGGLLRSWRIWNQKGINEIEDELTRKLGTRLPLEAFELSGELPPGIELNGSTLRSLDSAYEIGRHILTAFRNRLVDSPVHTDWNQLNEKTANRYPAKPGVAYFWDKSHLAHSNIQPGLLKIAPFGRTPPHQHPGSEILLVLEGEAQVHFPDSCTTVETVREHEVLHFDSSWRHSVISNSGTELVIWVLRESAAPQDLP